MTGTTPAAPEDAGDAQTSLGHIRKVDTAELRQIIRDEFTAHYQDVPGRDEVHKMIQSEVGRVRSETEVMVNARTASLEQRIDGLQQAVNNLVDMTKSVQQHLLTLNEGVMNNLKAGEARMSSFQARTETFDARLDLMEPVVRQVQDAVFGTLDGTPGLRALVVAQGAGQASLISSVGTLTAWVEQQKAQEKAIRERNERIMTAASNPWLWRAVMALLATALGIELSDLIGGM